MRPRTLISAVALVMIAVALVLAFGFVPGDDVGVARDGSVLAPGFHLPPVTRVAATGHASGASSPASREGAVVRLTWDATWTLRMAASREAALAWRHEPPEAAVPRLVDESLAAFALDRSADALTTAGVVAEAEGAVGARLAEAGMDARISLTPPVQEGGTAGLRQQLRAKDKRWKVVLVGVDGMDWRIADPLMAAGRMPHLAGLVARGARADLRSARPMLSPLLWTTMATGRRPEDHGICDFLAVDAVTGAPVPITSAFRRVPALWNIASEAGLESGFVAWWATWPAEPVRGFMVSDRLAYSLAEAGAPTQRLAFPPAFEKDVLALRVKPEDVDAGLVAPFVHDAPAGDERVQHLRRILAGALTYHASGLKLVERGDLPLVSVYYELVDEVGHRFMHLAPPQREGVGDADFAAFSGAVDAGYELQDRLLGELLGKAPKDAVVIVVSDHGFLSGSDRPAGTADVAGQPARWHRLLGVFAAAGPPVKAGTDLGVVGVEDVAPTVLHLVGLPVGEDMPGRPVLALDVPVLGIASYDEAVRLAHEAPAVSSPQLEKAALEELQALGYVGAQQAVSSRKVAPDHGGLGTTATYHLNAGLSLFEAGKYDEALKEARAAIDREPLPDAWALVSKALERKGDRAGAIDAEQRAVSLAPDMPELALRLVDLLVTAGRAKEAGRVATDLGRSTGTRSSAAALTAQGLAFRAAGDDGRAVQSLREALDADPEFAPAVSALMPIVGERGGLADVEPVLRAALAVNPALPVHREALGALELAQGRADEAAKELRVALTLDPNAVMARARLAMALMVAKDLDAAVVEAAAVRQADPAQADAWIMIGSVYGRSDQLAAALECLTKARKLGASSASLDVAEAVTRVQLGDEAGATRVLREGLARHPDDATLHELAAEFQRQGIGPPG